MQIKKLLPAFHIPTLNLESFVFKCCKKFLFYLNLCCLFTNPQIILLTEITSLRNKNNNKHVDFY